MLDQWFHLKTEDKDTVATLHLNKELKEEEEITFEDLSKWLSSKNIRHGLHYDTLSLISTSFADVEFPVEIAKGILPVDGAPAELQPIAGLEPSVLELTDEKIDFKQLFKIPTVTSGELVGRKKPATEGIPGINVFGLPIPSKKGKDLLIKNGENTIFNEEDLGIYATASGEISFFPKCINVYPVYRVNGDLSLETGNIDFIGNVHVTGNVPSGFKIKAHGDVRVEGLVEAAEISTPNSVVIGGGVLGQGKGSIRCGGNFTSLYINQGTIIAGESIHVLQSIMHSHCEAGDSIVCTGRKGFITGGSMMASQFISANEIGNETYAKTFIYMRSKTIDKDLLESLNKRIEELEQSLMKIKQLKTTLQEQSQHHKHANLIAALPRIDSTMSQTSSELERLYTEKNNLSLSEQGKNTSQVHIQGTIYPNVEINMGKYKRIINVAFKGVNVYMDTSEIVIQSL